MKIKSIILSALSAVIFTSNALFVHVSAEDMTILNSNEISDIVSAINTENSNATGTQSYSLNSETGYMDLTITDYDTEMAYKIYILKDLMITEYKNNPNFNDLIDYDNSRIQVPAKGKLVTLMEKDGVYQVIGSKFTDDFLDFKVLKADMISCINEEIVNIVHTYSFLYYMDIIYVKTAENEYVVPYFDDQINYGFGDRLISGTVYSVPEFMDRMDQTFDEEYLINHGDENIGIPIKNYTPHVPSFSQNISEKNEENNLITVALIIGVMAAAAFLTVFLIFNNSKNKKPEK